MKYTINTISKLIVFLTIVSVYTLEAQSKSPNILLITLDDMNWDSPGSYGGIIPDLTPHMDSLANAGMLFEKAYVQAPNCSPSRSVIQTGLYPHQSGMRGFYYAEPNGNTLPEILKNNGYTTGVLNKLADSSLSPDFERYWDVSKGIDGSEKRTASSYSKLFQNFLNGVNNDKPFYCVVNVADPHKPFFNDAESKKDGSDEFKPSKIYTLKDVEVPEFLPNKPKIKQEVLNYYNSVKRGDDCVGELLKTIRNSPFSKNTIIILLSDHGMPLPFAKSSLYPNGLRTPLIFSWPDKIAAKTKNKTNLVSIIDLAPTILNLVDISIPKTYEGHSFSSVLLGNEMESVPYIFCQFDENAGGVPRPSRTVINKKYGYIFNPWANGKIPFKSDADYHTSYKVMKKNSETDSIIKKRFDNWVYRATEELYDYENDPNALTNIINDPKHNEIVTAFRNQLMTQMIETNDYLLPAFENRKNKVFLNDWMEVQMAKATERAKTLKWKRYKNNIGVTKNNTELFNINNKKLN